MERTTNCAVYLFAFLSILAVAPVPLLGQSYTFSQIAALNGDTPFTSYFQPGSITNLDQIVFAPALASGGESVYVRQKGKLTAVAEGGQVLPDGGVVGYTLSPVSMNIFGEVAFTVTRDGVNDIPSPLGLNAGVYRYSPRTGVVPVMVPGLAGHGGSHFLGSSFISAINNRGEIAFPGMVCSTANNSVPSEPCPGGGAGVLAIGLYMADSGNRISAVVQPGDVAPGAANSTFDFARGPGINEAGDIAFTGHVFGEPCGNPGYPGQIFCDESLYIKRASTGVIESIAHSGAPSPVPGKNYSSSFGPVVNALGRVVFTSNLSVLGDGTDVAVFLYKGGKTIVVAREATRCPVAEP